MLLTNVLNSVTVIASSGASRTLAVNPVSTAVDPLYDVTLTANCAFTLFATAVGRMQSINVILRQDATGGRTASFSGVSWANNTTPTLNTTPGFYDVLRFFTVDGGASWFGSSLALGVMIPLTGDAALRTLIGANLGGGANAGSASYTTFPSNFNFGQASDITKFLAVGERLHAGDT